MFYNATLFNQDISGWVVDNVTPKPPTNFSTGSALTVENTPGGFFLTLASNNVTIQYIGNENDVPTSSARFIEANPRGTGDEWFAVVKDGMKDAIINYAKGLSGSSTLFTPQGQSQPVPFNNIVTTHMTDMSYMFRFTTFNQPLNAWDTSKVTGMGYMFYGPTAFNQPLNSWNVSNVTDMNFMFQNAIAFNQNLSGWNVALTPSRPSLSRDYFADGSPLALPENSHKLPLFE
jgi:surface protein